MQIDITFADTLSPACLENSLKCHLKRVQRQRHPMLCCGSTQFTIARTQYTRYSLQAYIKLDAINPIQLGRYSGDETGGANGEDTFFCTKFAYRNGLSHQPSMLCPTAVSYACIATLFRLRRMSFIFITHIVWATIAGPMLAASSFGAKHAHVHLKAISRPHGTLKRLSVTS